MRLTLLALMAAAMSLPAQADTILLEDFEDAVFTYTTSVADDLTDIANRDYFGRIAPDTSTPPVDVSYSNPQGSGYYGVQDTDSANSGDIDDITLDWTGINVSNFENLQLSWFVAEDDATDGNEDWDISTSFRILVQHDGGGYVQIFGIESENVADFNNPVGGDQTNEAPRVDTDFNGVGDGAVITDTFTQYLQSLANATTLDLRVEFEDFDTGDEDLAFDNFLLTGDMISAVPEPGSFAFLLVGGAFLGCRRRKRRA